MFLTLAIWILMIALTGVVGRACFSRVTFSDRPEEVLVSSWVGVGVLSNLWLGTACLVPLSPWVAVLTSALLLLVLRQRAARRPLLSEWQTLGSTAACLLAIALVIAAAVAVSPVTLLDTGIYHYPAMRWLVEYGVVKGTALLDVQLGYASPWFALFAPCLHGGLKTRAAALAGGFALALWLFGAGLSGLRLYRGAGRPGDWFFIWATALGVGAFSTAEGILASPSPDIPTAALITVVLWLLLDRENLPPTVRLRQNWVVAFLAGMATSIKLTAMPLLFVAGWLVWQSAARRWQAMLSFVALAALSLLPVTVARVLSSGCPLFPSKLLALPVAWRYEMNPWQYADGTPRSLTIAIRDQARWDWGALATVRYSAGPLDGWLDWRWLPAWPTHEPVAAGLLAGSCLATLVCLARRRTLPASWMWVLGSGWFGSLYVLLQAPALRFGVGYFIVPLALGLGQLSMALPRWCPLLVWGGGLCLLPLPAQCPLVRPPRLAPVPVVITEVNGMKLYRPVPRPGIFPHCGDSPLPCGSNIDPTVRLRDPRRGVAAGFVRGQKPEGEAL
ncbi:MAG: LIC_10190 family membrane protein [Acidobacteriota bacterium]